MSTGIRKWNSKRTDVRGIMELIGQNATRRGEGRGRPQAGAVPRTIAGTTDGRQAGRTRAPQAPAHALGVVVRLRSAPILRRRAEARGKTDKNARGASKGARTTTARQRSAKGRRSPSKAERDSEAASKPTNSTNLATLARKRHKGVKK